MRTYKIEELDSFIFSGGEPHIKCPVEKYLRIVANIRTSDDFMKLVMVLDAAKRQGSEVKELVIPYFPGARQDRVMNEGESLSVKVYADIINSFNIPMVTVLDPHSDVTSAVLNNCAALTNHAFVYQCLNKINAGVFHLVSPDAGANKKIKDLGKSLSDTFNFDIIKCDKTRDVSTGNITGFEVYADDLKGKPCVIVDDICDGGGTFLGLAKELKEKNAGDLFLVVTHGIFSKGFEELGKYFKHIYTSSSFYNQKSKLVTEITII